MPGTLDAQNLRRWADQCLDQANNPRVSGDERDRLLKMRNALRTLADNQDWLDGVVHNDSDLSDGEVQALAERITGIPPLRPKA